LFYKQILDELKVIDLSDSQNLIETPDLSRVPNLEQLILQRCTRLSKIHASLGNLKRLIHLDLNGCECLERLPHKINLKSLKVFILSGCSRLKKFPKIVRKMSRLSELYLNETTIKDLPSFVKHFTGLIKLDLRDCKNLSSLLDVICSLSSLETLTLSGCTKLDKLPEKLGDLKGLEELDVSGTAITELPSSVFYLKNLKVLSLGGCEGLLSKSSNEPLSFPLMEIRSDPMGMLVPRLLELRTLRKLNLSYCNLWTIPDGLGSLCSLRDLNLNGNNFVSLPESISRLSNLDSLYFCGCTGLRSLPQLPFNVGYIYADGCTSLETLPLRPEYDFYLYLSLLNCIKLIDNQGYGDMFLTMLRHHLQLQVSLSPLSFFHSLSLSLLFLKD
jgi:Leucine-rich repeat (LRR) protein